MRNIWLNIKPEPLNPKSDYNARYIPSTPNDGENEPNVQNRMKEKQ
jgi:hypothetical protein